MRTLLLILCFGLIGSGPLPLLGEDVPALTNAYFGKVLSVHDGDTVNVEITLGFDMHMSPVAIRMVGVFAPELGRPGGAEATAKLKELLPVGVPVIIRPLMTANASPNHEIMTFQRYVARVWRAGTASSMDVCEEMAKWLGAPQGSGSKATREISEHP